MKLIRTVVSIAEGEKFRQQLMKYLSFATGNPWQLMLLVKYSCTSTKDDPGYVSCLPCCKHDPNGRSWEEVLIHEINYMHQNPCIPILGALGHSAAELLA
jgi:hypothetical protein